MSFEFSEIVKLSEDLKHMSKNTDKAIEATAKDLAMMAIRQTKLLTPVDIGDLRKHWEVDVVRKGKEVHVILFNPMEYAGYVELGHRIVGKVNGVPVTVGWQEGAFMATTTMEDLIPLVGKIFSGHIGGG